MTQVADIAAQLAEPFSVEDIDFLPKGKIERDGKTLCMALPYADPRVYQDRLNAIAYGEWSTPAPVVIVAGNKLICYVTVILYGVPHTDVGEANNNEENTGTEAWAQAFKRACSQFGLGRYLYTLEKEWVPFDLKGKRIDLDKAGKQAIVRKMYQKAGIPTSKAIDAQSPALLNLIAKAKNRAAELNCAHNKSEWEAFLQECTGEVLTDKDLTLDKVARVNGKLTQIERERQKTAASVSGK